MKLRKLKKAQAKASRDAHAWTGGVPVMDTPPPVAPAVPFAIQGAPSAVSSGIPREVDAADEDEGAAAVAVVVADAANADEAEQADEADEVDNAAQADEVDKAAQADEIERVALAETMYRAAQARFEAAEAREQAAAERLDAAETAEGAAAARLTAAERGEQDAAERLAAAADRERAVAERLVAAEARERAASERIAAAEARERAVADRLAAADARERAAAERDAIANQRDRTAAERDAIANERDRASIERDRGSVDRGGRAGDRANAGAGDTASEPELEIARLKALLERAHLDSLTGALRREIGRLTLHNEIERARRGDGQFVLAFVDVDDLKGINDREGHAAGDRVLRTLAATLRANLRTYDPVVRYGGDEFVCGVTGVSATELEHRMTLIDQSLRRATGVGISAGLATLREGETLDEITARADEALLEAKRGRDR